MIDTSILIGSERGTVRFTAFLDTLGTEPIAMAAITASELLHGYHRASDAGIRARRGAFVEALIDAIPVLPFGLPEARCHAELWADLTRKGTIVGAHDLIICATALAHGYALATLNRREFAQVSGLRLIPLEPFIVREAVTSYLSAPAAGGELPSITGRFASGTGDTSEYADELLWKTEAAAALGELNLPVATVQQMKQESEPHPDDLLP